MGQPVIMAQIRSQSVLPAHMPYDHVHTAGMTDGVMIMSTGGVMIFRAGGVTVDYVDHELPAGRFGHMGQTMC